MPEDDRPTRWDRLLLRSRSLVISREVSDRLADRVFKQLLILEEMDPQKPITVYVNSPGGSADSGFAIFDMMRFVRAPVRTVCSGLCASAAVMIYLGARKGQRYSFPNSRFLIHQPSTAAFGAASDIEITANEILAIRERYNTIVADETGRKASDVEKDANRDFWLPADRAKEYGLVDRIVATRSELDGG
ncbi:MAG: ATP-dependent Clp protease proteolytic subunit [Planctomycetales bacterium]|nr:ATP-dependent Clp protease proteolytic subunit [Planctomycetales bacterium]